MAYTGQITGWQRAVSVGGALIAVLAVGVGLASGLDLDVVRKANEAITAIAIPAPQPPREPPIPQNLPDEKASGKASVANKHAKAGPRPCPQTQASADPTADCRRPALWHRQRRLGGRDAEPRSRVGRRRSGRRHGGRRLGHRNWWRHQSHLAQRNDPDRDYPETASRAKAGGEVETRFTIQPTGRVTHCRITRSSGDAALDATTCRLIEQRFRFKPATNTAGEAIASEYGWRQSWWLEPRR